MIEANEKLRRKLKIAWFLVVYHILFYWLLNYGKIIKLRWSKRSYLSYSLYAAYSGFSISCRKTYASIRKGVHMLITYLRIIHNSRASYLMIILGMFLWAYFIIFYKENTKVMINSWLLSPPLFLSDCKFLLSLSFINFS